MAIVLALLVSYAIWPSWRTPGDSLILATIMMVMLCIGALEPGRRLTVLQRSRTAILAELSLMPGMPHHTELPAALMRQTLRCQGERLALLALSLPVVLHLQYAPKPVWWGWWACFIPLLLLVGTASAWLAWHRLNRFLLWEGTLILGFIIASVINVHLLTHREPLPTHWLIIGVVWLALATGVFWWLNRSLSTQKQKA